jgi:hydrogenase expression/formation protein HypC
LVIEDSLREWFFMCLAVPAKVVSIDGIIAQADMMGNMTSADISLLEKVNIGDYIIVHAGFAIQKYDEDEAKATLDLLKELFEKTGAGGNES